MTDQENEDVGSAPTAARSATEGLETAEAEQPSVHPRCAMLPLLPNGAYEMLKSDIQKNGLERPILVDRLGAIVDGRHRLRACSELGIELRYVTVEDDAVVRAILESALGRRNLSQSQRAAIVAANCDYSATFGHGGNRRQVLEPKLESVADRCGMAGVGESTQAQADYIAQHDPTLLKRVIDDGLSVGAAYKLCKQAEPDGGKQKKIAHEICKQKENALIEKVDTIQKAAREQNERATSLIASLRAEVARLTNVSGAVSASELDPRVFGFLTELTPEQ